MRGGVELTQRLERSAVLLGRSAGCRTGDISRSACDWLFVGGPEDGQEEAGSRGDGGWWVVEVRLECRGLRSMRRPCKRERGGTRTTVLRNIDTASCRPRGVLEDVERTGGMAEVMDGLESQPLTGVDVDCCHAQIDHQAARSRTPLRASRTPRSPMLLVVLRRHFSASPTLLLAFVHQHCEYHLQAPCSSIIALLRPGRTH